MNVKVVRTQCTKDKLINQLEEDYRIFETYQYAIHDYFELKGFFEIDFYLPEAEDEEVLLSFLQDNYPELSNFRVCLEKQEDWFEKWKQSLKPVWLTERF